MGPYIRRSFYNSSVHKTRLLDRMITAEWPTEPNSTQCVSTRKEQKLMKFAHNNIIIIKGCGSSHEARFN